MKKEAVELPLSTVTLAFGVLSILLSWARQLCAPAAIMGVLAIAFHLWGRRRRKGAPFTATSLKRSRLGFTFALIGTASAVFYWWLGYQ
jgi:hypothetical protein